jgi:hypothetical protein
MNTSTGLVRIVIFLVGVLVGVVLINNGLIKNPIILTKDINLLHLLGLVSFIFVGLYIADSFKQSVSKGREEKDLLIKTVDEIKGIYSDIFTHYSSTKKTEETRFDKVVGDLNSASLLIADFQKLSRYAGLEKKIRTEVNEWIQMNKNFKASLTDTDTREGFLIYTEDQRPLVQEDYFDLIHAMNKVVIKINRLS